MNEHVDAMLGAGTFAVVGASTNREKYGYIAYADLKRYGKTVYPVNPRATEIDGDRCYASVRELPVVPEVVVAVVPSKLTEALVGELAEIGVRNVWMQPGAESAKAIADAEAAGLNVTANGPCVMVGLRTMGFRKGS